MSQHSQEGGAGGAGGDGGDGGDGGGSGGGKQGYTERGISQIHVLSEAHDSAVVTMSQPYTLVSSAASASK